MKVTEEMIDEQLRLRGRLFRRLRSNLTEDKVRRSGGARAKITSFLMRLRRPKDLQVVNEWVERPDGSRLRLAVCSARGRSTSTAADSAVTGILWLHGGGYAIGSPEMDLPLLRQLMDVSDCVVVSPEYRLSVDAPYPAAIDDSYTALKWLRDNASRLGVREDQIAVGGPSAGGGLAAALTLLARDKGEVAVAFQMPLFPMIDDRSITESARENDAPVWDAVTNRSAWKVYLGELYGSENVPPYAAAARATDYSGLPPTLTYVGGVEPFRDETIEYVRNLHAAGVPVEFKVFEGCWHGFDGLAPKARVSIEARDFRNAWFRRATHEYFAAQPTRSHDAPD